MVVFQDGKPRKSEYKRFKIDGIGDQNDYASMEQALRRRYNHYLEHTEGFDTLPDLLLIDGGTQHVNVAVNVINELGLQLNVFGMVKDDRHRTRALISSNGEEIAITNQQAVFSLIGTIQEETHRFAIGYHKKLRSKRMRYSKLDNIPGIGDKRKQDLLKRYKSLKAIAAAPLADLELILPQDAAYAVYQHFHRKGDE
jgi:excinuclease ABC subunit C